MPPPHIHHHHSLHHHFGGAHDGPSLFQQISMGDLGGDSLSHAAAQYLPLSTVGAAPGEPEGECEDKEDSEDGKDKEELCLADRPAFHTLIGVVIVFNAAIIGLETDYEWCGWFWVDQVLVAIYTTELAIRFHRHRLHFFSWHNHEQIWNILDLVIIVSGLVEAWLQPILHFLAHLLTGWAGQSEEHRAKVHHVRQIVMLARMMRILKILRFLKLVKFLEPLYLLVTGVLAAVESVFWVLVLTFMVLYAMGIMVTRMVGHGLMFSGEGGAPEGVSQYFETVPISTFTLFRMMSGVSSDPEIQAFDDVMSEVPAFKVAFSIFVVSCSWTLLSILTAVVSENMIHNTEEHDEELEIVNEGENRKKRIEELTQLLKPCGFSPDGATGGEGGPRRVTSVALELFLAHKENTQNIAHCCGVPIRDIKDVFEALQLSSSGEGVPMSDFIESLVDVGRSVTEKSVLKLEARLYEIERGIFKKESALAETVTDMIIELLHKQEAHRDKSIMSLHDNIAKLESSFSRLGEANGEHHKLVTEAVSVALGTTLDKLRSDLSVAGVHEALQKGISENLEALAKQAARCEAIADRAEESFSTTPLARSLSPQPRPVAPMMPEAQSAPLPLRMVGSGGVAAASSPKLIEASAPQRSGRLPSLSPTPTARNWSTSRLFTPAAMGSEAALRQVPAARRAPPPLDPVLVAGDATTAGRNGDGTNNRWRTSLQAPACDRRAGSPQSPGAKDAGRSEALKQAEERLRALRSFSSSLPLAPRETSSASNGSEDALTVAERERQTALRHRDFAERERNAEMRTEELNVQIQASELRTSEIRAREVGSVRSIGSTSGSFTRGIM